MPEHFVSQDYEIYFEEWEHGGGLYPAKADRVVSIPFRSRTRSRFLRDWLRKFEREAVKYTSTITLPGETGPPGGLAVTHYKRKFIEVEADVLELAGYCLGQMEENERCQLLSRVAECVTPTPPLALSSPTQPQ